MRHHILKISALTLIFHCLFFSQSKAFTFSVDNTNDSFFGSLRQAIDDANATPGLDTIEFNISGGGPHYISPTSPFSDITDSVFIDGSSENSFLARPLNERLIVIQGFSVVGDCFRFDVGSDGSEIKHLVINQFFSGAGIANLGANDLKITGCYIGIDEIGGSPGFGNATGIVFLGATNGCQIGDTITEGGNVISDNLAHGIDIRSGNNNITIMSNYIGLGPDGSTPFGNQTEGINIQGSTGIQIGGTSKKMRNIIGYNGISGNFPGINMLGVTSSSILNNFIGVDPTGMLVAGNAGSGIALNGCNNITIGTSGVGNVISGNFLYGIEITNSSNNNFIQSNLIGVDSSASNAISNGSDGIYIDNSEFNIIGGNIPFSGNTISGNSNQGIALFNNANNNTISGNYIGTNSLGSTSLGNNLYAINIDNSSYNLIGELNGRNFIGNNNNGGIIISGTFTGSYGNELYNNFFGLAPDSTTAIPNSGSALFFDNEADSNVVGGYGDSMNVFAYNGAAISVGPPSTGTPEYNIFNLNSIYNNGSGIFVDALAQHGVKSPQITCVLIDSTMNGKGAPLQTIYIYADGNTQSAYFLDTAIVKSDGTWSKKLDLNYLSGLGVDSLTALQDSAGNSSEFAPTIRLDLIDPTIVTNTFDDGCGSLRFAIDYSNGTGTQETIQFNIPGAGPHIIQPAVQLPNITSSVIIDGSSQNVFEGIPADSHFVVIDGVNLLPADIFIIDASASSTVLNHLVIGNTIAGNAIANFASDVTISNNYLGVSHTGSGSFGSNHGVFFQGSGIIDNNVISSNSDAGIVIDASTNVALTNNKIGTDKYGNQFSGNTGAGILIQNNSSFVDIGTPGQGNVIANNGNWGLFAQNSSDINVYGNFIGTDITGKISMGNSNAGVEMLNCTKITIGGNSAGNENVISGNLGYGINFSATDSSFIIGNYIGTDITGDTAIPGSGDGIFFQNGSNRNVIGGGTPGDGNIISGQFNGIYFQDAGTINNYVIGNKIGVASNGIDSISNFGSGIVFENNSSDNYVGGTTSDSANIIGYNSDDGISLVNALEGIKISGNRFFHNGDLAIDINNDGVSTNDVGDVDSGPNSTLNAPDMSSAVINAGNYVIDYGYNGLSGTSFEIQFYASTIDDPTGHGEGEVYIGSEIISTDGAGSFNTSGTSFTEVPGLQYISAIAIDPLNNTSEFSNTIVATPLTNTAPIAVNDTVLLNQGETQNAIVLSNDMDAEGNIDVSSVTVLSGLDNGLALVQADGTIQIDYSSNGTFVGFDTLEYSVCDSTGLCDTAFAFIEILDTGYCEAGVTSHIVDLTGSPDSVWTSPSDVRVANSCCGANNGAPTFAKCISFIVTIDPGTSYLMFDIASGARPPGILNWNLNCSGNYTLGVPVSVIPGTYTLSFCAAGSNANTYEIVASQICDSLLVTSTLDDNACGTFRVALQYADSHSGADTINFAINNDTIFTQSTLSLSSDSNTYINGSGTGLWIQPDFPVNFGTDVFYFTSKNSIYDGISINAEQRGMSGTKAGIGLHFDLGSSQVKNSTIRNAQFTNAQIIGLDIASSDSCYIENCHFYNNQTFGLAISSNYSKVVQCTFGTDTNGTALQGSQLFGLGVSGFENTIGGDITAESNIFGGADSAGIIINASSPNYFYGNLIGTDIAGTTALPNKHGILSQFSLDQKIGDGTLNHRNIISGNTSNGIFIDNAFGNNINFNYIGTDITGMSALPNGTNGVFLTQDPTTDTIQNSIIANNGSAGINLEPGNQNLFYNNSIHSNSGDGIEILGDNQGSIFPPIITQINSDSTINGNNDNGALVEFFADYENEGRLKLGEITPIGTTFSYKFTSTDLLIMAAQGLDSITAIQTVAGSSSEFSTTKRACIPLPIITHSIDTVPMSSQLILDTLESILAGYGNGPTITIIDSTKGGQVNVSGIATFNYSSYEGYFNKLDSMTYLLSNNCGWSDTNKIFLFVENSPPFELTTYRDRLAPSEIAVVNINKLIDDINKNLKIDSIVLADTLTQAGAEIRIDNPGFITVDYSVIPSADNFSEEVSFTVCDSLDKCINAKLSFEITSNPPDPIVHNALSLGSDNLNDVLIIENIDEPEYEGNEIWIYNKWGFEVFHKVNYNNDEPWDGRYKGKFLPTGTYSYFIKRGFEKETSDGFIEIIKE